MALLHQPTWGVVKGSDVESDVALTRRGLTDQW